MKRNILELANNRRSPEDMLAGLKDKDTIRSREAGLKLCKDASEFGLTIPDYLNLGIDVSKSPAAARYGELNGLEAAFAYLDLPVREDLASGVLLNASANTFNTYDGTRALFPATVDAILRWKNKINMIEYVAPMLGNSRSIAGPEMITTWVEDDTTARQSYTIAEGGKIPTRDVVTSEQTVKIYKHGSGYKFTAEFLRRAALDVITPFAARVQRQLELSKVMAATGVLINGDGVNPAATVVTSTSCFVPSQAFPTYVANGTINYNALLGWFVQRAQAQYPVDVVVGNYAMLCQWMLLFTPMLNGNRSLPDAISEAGGAPKLLAPDLPVFPGNVKFVISSSVPNGQLIGVTLAETLEELKESGSEIAQAEQLISTQEWQYQRTESSGYKLIFPLGRQIINFNA